MIVIMILRYDFLLFLFFPIWVWVVFVIFILGGCIFANWNKIWWGCAQAFMIDNFLQYNANMSYY